MSTDQPQPPETSTQQSIAADDYPVSSHPVDPDDADPNEAPPKTAGEAAFRAARNASEARLAFEDIGDDARNIFEAMAAAARAFGQP